jgi:hypothetical protein
LQGKTENFHSLDHCSDSFRFLKIFVAKMFRWFWVLIKPVRVFACRGGRTGAGLVISVSYCIDIVGGVLLL